MTVCAINLRFDHGKQQLVKQTGFISYHAMENVKEVAVQLMIDHGVVYKMELEKIFKKQKCNTVM